MSGELFTPYSERVQAAKRRHDEDDLQRNVISYLRLALPHDAIAWHCPNGGMRSPREAARLKAMGVLPGMPDIGICWRGMAIFIELKTRTGYVTPVQKDLHKQLHVCGAAVMVARSVEEVAALLLELGMPVRAKFAPFGAS